MTLLYTGLMRITLALNAPGMSSGLLGNNNTQWHKKGKVCVCVFVCLSV